MSSYRLLKGSLIGVPIAVFLILFIWNIRNYMGVYEDLIQLILLATAAVFIPSLLDGKNALKPVVVGLISFAMCAVSLVLFLFTKPVYTTQQAAQMLIDEGYASIAIGEDGHTERISEGANFFVSKGYLYVCRTDEKGENTDKVLFNPQTGEWSVVE